MRRFLAVLVLGLGVLAQTDAAQLLDKARTIHGGAA